MPHLGPYSELICGKIAAIATGPDFERALNYSEFATGRCSRPMKTATGW
jgi:hypothetical protein